MSHVKVGLVSEDRYLVSDFESGVEFLDLWCIEETVGMESRSTDFFWVKERFHRIQGFGFYTIFVARFERL